MKKKIVLLFAVIALIAAAGILIFTRQPETRFDGERISDPGHFALQFEWMNMTDSETMALKEGDILHISWRIESGQIDTVVGLEGEEPILFGLQSTQSGAQHESPCGRLLCPCGQKEMMRTGNRGREK